MPGSELTGRRPAMMSRVEDPSDVAVRTLAARSMLFALVLASMTTRALCQALVPYCPATMGPLHLPERQFYFAEKQFALKQSWNELGVAAVVWNASVAMSEWMESGVIDIKRKRILELGSGTGLAGIVASALGGHVTLTDRAQALDLLQKNVDLNRSHLTEPITVSELDWGQNLDAFALKHGNDWDVILGADVVYDESVFDSLLLTLTRLSSASTKVYLSCKIRYERDVRFIRSFENRFASVEVAYSKDHDVKLYCGRLN